MAISVVAVPRLVRQFLSMMTAPSTTQPGQTYGRHWGDVGTLPRLVLTAVLMVMTLAAVAFLEVAWGLASYVAIAAFAITITFALALAVTVTAPLLSYGWQSLCRSLNLAITRFAATAKSSATSPTAPMTTAVHWGIPTDQTSGRHRRDAGTLPRLVLGFRTTTQHRIVHGMTLGVT